jgi:hypothetical protein
MPTRRIFLQQSGLIATSLAFSPLTIAQSPKKDRLGVAFVGLGYYSTDLLAPALQLTKNCYLAGIVTGTPSKAEQWTKKYNIPEKNVYNYENFDKIANNPDIDVVYVVLPPSMHREYVVRAAKAGKHVWVEKPMAVTEKECQDMIDACKQNKRLLAVGYRLQHEPNTQEYIKFLREGKDRQDQNGQLFGGVLRCPDESLEAEEGNGWGRDVRHGRLCVAGRAAGNGRRTHIVDRSTVYNSSRSVQKRVGRNHDGPTGISERSAGGCANQLRDEHEFSARYGRKRVSENGTVFSLQRPEW